MSIQAALQAADQMLEGMEGSHTVLRVIIDNMLYPITVDILKQVPVLLVRMSTIFSTPVSVTHVIYQLLEIVFVG